MPGATVSALWRYPVKSLRGEQLESVSLTSDGVPGDRIVHVAGPNLRMRGSAQEALQGCVTHSSAN